MLILGELNGRGMQLNRLCWPCLRFLLFLRRVFFNRLDGVALVLLSAAHTAAGTQAASAEIAAF